MRRNPNIVLRPVNPANFLVDITKCYNDSSEYLLEIDEVGVAIWNCIRDDSTREQITNDFLDLLTDEKDEEFITMVTQDVNEFIDYLISNQCVLEG